MPVSQNGYTANDISRTKVWTIPGTTREVRLRADNCGYLLCHFASWWDAHIEPIDQGILDDWGYAERDIRGMAPGDISNHASGTALDINATKRPLGADPHAALSQAQIDAIHRQLAKYQGALRWGGDYNGRKDPMHVEINASMVVVNVVAAILQSVEAGKQVLTRVLPIVDESNVRRQARNGGPKALPGVRRIQRALNLRLHLDLAVDGHFGPATLYAYSVWQHKLGYSGSDDNGVPGTDSLKLLGTKRFRVVK